MIHPDTEQVFLLSDYFHQLGTALGVYIEHNEMVLSQEYRNQLYDEQIELLRISGSINMAGVSLVFEDIQDTLHRMEAITAGVNEAVKKALAIQDAINIATAVVSLGTAILAKDPQSIVDNTVKAGKAMGSINIKT